LRTFLVVMLMFGIITSLHGMSPLATYGLGAVFFLLLATICFLIPAGLVAAELGTGWQRDGGVYVWVTEAFGPRAGFVAAFLQWFQNVIFWTVILTSSAAMLALSVGWDGGLDSAPYTAAVVVGTIWLITLLTIRGLRTSGAIGTIGSVAGTIAPGLALIVLAAIFLLDGNKSNVSFELSNLIPDLSKSGNLTFGISTIVIFAGIEVMATRVAEIRNPARTYPRATLISIAMVAGLLIPTTLAIAVLVPNHELSITAGIVQAVQTVFDDIWMIGWLVPVFAIAIWIDSVGEIAGWMAGTPVAMATAGKDGHLPEKLTSTTTRGVPKPMLITQAVVGSMITLLFVVEPTVASLFWVLSAMLVQLYLLMYMMLFASALRLRRTRADVPRAFRIPAGPVGIWLVCGVGMVFSIAAFVVGFIPPASLTGSSLPQHLAILGGGIAIGVLVPLGLSWKRRRHSHPVWLTYRLREASGTSTVRLRVMPSNSVDYPRARAWATAGEDGGLTVAIGGAELEYERRFTDVSRALDAQALWLAGESRPG
jgi:amino acid transporter